MTIEDICAELRIDKDIAKFQDLYNPAHLYCRLREISDYDFKKELKQYEAIYKRINFVLKQTYKK